MSEVQVMSLENDEGVWVYDMKPTLDNLQNAVNGMIEMVPVMPGVAMWVNEEGLMRESTMNVYASLLASVARFSATTIMGKALLTGIDEQGEVIGLTDDQVEHLKGVCGIEEL